MNRFQDIFDAQKGFSPRVSRAATNGASTNSTAWPHDQRERAALSGAIAEDFKTARRNTFRDPGIRGEVEVQKSQLKEWMKPVEAPVPRFLAKLATKDDSPRALRRGTDHRPFNGPLLLLIRRRSRHSRPATPVFSHSVKRSWRRPRCCSSLSAVFRSERRDLGRRGKEQNTELLKLKFDFIFFTGSTLSEDRRAAAAENLTPSCSNSADEPGARGRNRKHPDAAKKIVWARWLGRQWCTSPGYAYVHESVAEDLSQKPKRRWSSYL